MKRPPRMVLVRWVDAIGPDGEGWTEAGEYRGRQKTQAEVLTAGFLMHRDRHWVRVAGSFDQASDHVNGVMQIPASMVISIQTLRPGSGPKTAD